MSLEVVHLAARWWMESQSDRVMKCVRGKCPLWTTLDLLFNYTFNLPPPAPAEVPGFAKDGGKNVKSGKDGKEKNVVPVSTAEYGCSNWKWWLNNTTVTLGMQNVDG